MFRRRVSGAVVSVIRAQRVSAFKPVIPTFPVAVERPDIGHRFYSDLSFSPRIMPGFVNDEQAKYQANHIAHDRSDRVNIRKSTMSIAAFNKMMQALQSNIHATTLDLTGLNIIGDDGELLNNEKIAALLRANLTNNYSLTKVICEDRKDDPAIKGFCGLLAARNLDLNDEIYHFTKILVGPRIIMALQEELGCEDVDLDEFKDQIIAFGKEFLFRSHEDLFEFRERSRRELFKWQMGDVKKYADISWPVLVEGQISLGDEDGHYVKFASCHEDLYEFGKVGVNCLGSYSEKCLSGKCQIAGIFNKEGKLMGSFDVISNSSEKVAFAREFSFVFVRGEKEIDAAIRVDKLRGLGLSMVMRLGRDIEANFDEVERAATKFKMAGCGDHFPKAYSQLGFNPTDVRSCKRAAKEVMKDAGFYMKDDCRKLFHRPLRMVVDGRIIDLQSLVVPKPLPVSLPREEVEKRTLEKRKEFEEIVAQDKELLARLCGVECDIDLVEVKKDGKIVKRLIFSDGDLGIEEDKLFDVLAKNIPAFAGGKNITHLEDGCMIDLAPKALRNILQDYFMRQTPATKVGGVDVSAIAIDLDFELVR